ncbi:hypothetical protein [Paenibacillus spongiae]|uniref:DUF5105 domain-containing protein n=1 Tax=Paenibacillus spongiae TaxID=2909671 RepID=A0ABY5S5N5_9BACL|nr:hypothetical protein [Paenibacillus spongiae]UVI28150.1 hypothetical protein L1F29_22190 [Paenibacillus spongiae]
MRPETLLLSSIFCLFIILAGCSKIETDGKEVKKLESDYSIVKDKIYHVLVDEYLKTKDQNNSSISVLFREYQVYDGNKDNVYQSIVSVSLPNEIETIIQAKVDLQTYDSEWLKLKPLTIISEKVLSQWKSEEYQGESEYWTGSPKELTLEKIINGSN